ncbi:MAG: hypothetical protein V2A54_15255, partial [Bacteroidota bacterium]
MKKTIFLLTFFFVSVLCHSQDYTEKHLKCLVGTPLNNPVFLEFLGKTRIRMPHFFFNEIILKGSSNVEVTIKNGKVLSFFNLNSPYEETVFPEEWGVKRNYSDMKKTMKDLPKIPKDKSQHVHVDLEKDSLKINLMYAWVNEEFRLESLYIVGYNDKPTPCAKVPELRVWEHLMGKDGKGLSAWLCENLDKTLPASFLTENFLPLEMVEDRSKALRLSTNDFYFDQPIRRGDYFYSFDGTVVLRMEDNKLKGVLLYSRNIPIPVFPEIGKDITLKKLKEKYKRLKDHKNDVNEVYFLTPYISIDFNFWGGDNLNFVYINRLLGGAGETCLSDIIFNKPLPRYVNIGEKHKTSTTDKDIEDYISLENIAELKQNSFNLSDEYEFTLKKGETAKVDNYFMPGTDFYFLARANDVDDIEISFPNIYMDGIEQIDSNKSDKGYGMLYFPPVKAGLSVRPLLISYRSSADSCTIKLFVMRRFFDYIKMEKDFEVIILPKRIQKEVDSMGY